MSGTIRSRTIDYWQKVPLENLDYVKCGAIRSPDSDRSPVCELPRGHDGTHFGRSYAGRWFDWPSTSGRAS